MPRMVCGSAAPRASARASRIETEASAWIARLDAREPTERLTRRFERWRSASPRHEAAYLRLLAAWRMLDRLRLCTDEQALRSVFGRIPAENPRGG